MKIHDMLPGLDDDALATVRINANRLSVNGTPKQKDQALVALRLVEEEVARRQAARPPPAPRTVKRTRKAAPTEG